VCTSNIRRFHSLHAIIMPIAACYLNIFYRECGLWYSYHLLNSVFWLLKLVLSKLVQDLESCTSVVANGATLNNETLYIHPMYLGSSLSIILIKG
jgi:hypothetical protein